MQRGVIVHDEDGASLVEFALVIVVLLTLVVGVITYGMVLGLHQSITHAASSAARAAITVRADDVGAVESRVGNVVDDQLSWMGARAAHVTTTTSVATCPVSGGTCVNVEVSYPYATVPIVPSFLGLPIPDRVASTAVAEMEPVP